MKEFIDKYFQEQDILKECLLLEYYYDEAASTFTWVGRPGNFFEIDWSRNPFFKVHFTGVLNYLHTFPDPGAGKTMTHNYSSFFAEKNTGTYLAYGSRLQTDGNRYLIEIDMTYELGYITFIFMDVEVEFLFTNYKKVGENHVYFHPETNVPIDFNHPFGRVGRF